MICEIAEDVLSESSEADLAAARPRPVSQTK
jgi:hypothetical protein